MVGLGVVSDLNLVNEFLLGGLLVLKWGDKNMELLGVIIWRGLFGVKLIKEGEFWEIERKKIKLEIEGEIKGGIEK